MSRHRISYTETARNSIRHLPPSVKPMIRAMIENLAAYPYTGKQLQHELVGYWSCRFQRWRVIYTIEEDERRIIVHLVEKRISVYETLKGLMA